MFKLPKILILLLAFCSASAFADGNYISVGGTNISSGGDSITGFGFSWAAFGSDTEKMGVITTSSFATEEYGSVRGNLFDVNVGPIFKMPNADWFRVYPLVGFTYVTVEGCIYNYGCYEDDDVFFNYGIGVQLSIPNTDIFGDVNVKKVSGDAEATITYFGLGYHF